MTVTVRDVTTTGREATMNAIVQDQYGDAEEVLRLEEIERPQAGDDEVLLRVCAAGQIQGEKGTTMARLLTNSPRLLRLESAALLAISLLLYWKIGGNWLAFALLLLVPDASMVGYMGGNQIGATVYNLVHLYLWPSILAVIGILTFNEVILSLALVWFAHISMDRSLGYGLKLPTGFKHTHLDTGQPLVPADHEALIGSSVPVILP